MGRKALKDRNPFSLKKDGKTVTDEPGTMFPELQKPHLCTGGASTGRGGALGLLLGIRVPRGPYFSKKGKYREV